MSIYRSMLSNQSIIKFLVIGNEPVKTSYFQTESLDLTGLRVLLVDSSGSIDVTSSCTISHSIMTDVGTITVTVSYLDLTATFDVTVTISARDPGGFYIPIRMWALAENTRLPII